MYYFLIKKNITASSDMMTLCGFTVCTGLQKSSANQATKKASFTTEMFTVCLNLISCTMPWLIACFFPMNT